MFNRSFFQGFLKSVVYLVKDRDSQSYYALRQSSPTSEEGESEIEVTLFRASQTHVSPPLVELFSKSIEHAALQCKNASPCHVATRPQLGAWSAPQVLCMTSPTHAEHPL